GVLSVAAAPLAIIGTLAAAASLMRSWLGAGAVLAGLTLGSRLLATVLASAAWPVSDARLGLLIAGGVLLVPSLAYAHPRRPGRGLGRSSARRCASLATGRGRHDRCGAADRRVVPHCRSHVRAPGHQP
ncbi:MAG TPA: hypothetical protein VGJ28_00930, partial [Micromonosporaceae bacterium]